MAEMLSLSHDLIFCSLPLQRVDKKNAQEKKVCLYFSETVLKDWIDLALSERMDSGSPSATVGMVLGREKLFPLINSIIQPVP